MPLEKSEEKKLQGPKDGRGKGKGLIGGGHGSKNTEECPDGGPGKGQGQGRGKGKNR